jgi:hypothetical protein
MLHVRLVFIKTDSQLWGFHNDEESSRGPRGCDAMSQGAFRIDTLWLRSKLLSALERLILPHTGYATWNVGLTKKCDGYLKHFLMICIFSMSPRDWKLYIPLLLIALYVAAVPGGGRNVAQFV